MEGGLWHHDYSHGKMYSPILLTDTHKQTISAKVGSTFVVSVSSIGEYICGHICLMI